MDGSSMTTTASGEKVFVRKRAGSLQQFDRRKIQNALYQSFLSSEAEINISQLAELTYLIEQKILLCVKINGRVTVGIEQIQDLVEEALREKGYDKIAAHYNDYRLHRAAIRAKRSEPDPLAVSNYIHAGKYARFSDQLGRREVYEETVDRNLFMHLKVYPKLEKLLKWSYGFVYRKEVLPSMRSFQFGGAAILKNHGRMYNCTFSLCDRPEFFAEAFWLLLCGSGVGYSVQWHHVDCMPVVKNVDDDTVSHHICEDTIEGWADAIDFLMDCYFNTGKYPEFSFHKIRKRGTPLKTSGGKAPGHKPLKLCIERVRNILEAAQGRKLRPIECHDIVCHTAEAVLSGGIRRSSLISLFSIDDGEMMMAKTGDWHKKNSQRKLANNSACCYLDSVTKEQFERIFKMNREWGEPGIYFSKGRDYVCNPCAEIGGNPTVILDDENIELIQEWFLNVESRRNNYDSLTKRAVVHRMLSPDRRTLMENKGKKLTGWQVCNLTLANCATVKSAEELYERVRAATIIGTCQAGYTNLKYLSWVSRYLVWRESLIGVSLSGMMDTPDVALDPEVQRKAAEVVVSTNKEISKIVGIRPAARATTVKPDGTASLELGCIGSGIHAHHARRYFRRVTANPLEPVFQYFFSINPHMCEQKPDGDYVIVFPVKAPENAVTVKEMGAIDFLEKVHSTYQNWILPGTVDDHFSPNLTHNVSCTVVARDNEWPHVFDFMWDHRSELAAVSFLPYIGDKKYAFAPREEVKTDEDEKKWQFLIDCYTPVDYTKFKEAGDNTALKGEAACSGGACEIHI